MFVLLHGAQKSVMFHVHLRFLHTRASEPPLFQVEPPPSLIRPPPPRGGTDKKQKERHKKKAMIQIFEIPPKHGYRFTFYLQTCSRFIRHLLRPTSLDRRQPYQAYLLTKNTVKMVIASESPTLPPFMIRRSPMIFDDLEGRRRAWDSSLDAC